MEEFALNFAEWVRTNAYDTGEKWYYQEDNETYTTEELLEIYKKRIMTPKEKAKELMQKSYDLDKYNKTPNHKCKEISLLIVDEILSMKIVRKDDLTDEYLEEVKREIELL